MKTKLYANGVDPPEFVPVNVTSAAFTNLCWLRGGCKVRMTSDLAGEVVDENGRVVGGVAIVDGVSHFYVRSEAPAPKKKPHTLSCGCCTGGCVCSFHQDTPRGIRPHLCDDHREHGHPGATEEFAA